MEHFVEFEGVSKYYQTGSVKIAAADHLNFYVDKGEFCIIVGPSGAGKTTLLNILGGMDTCDEGNVWLDGQNVSHFTERELTTYSKTWSWPARSAVTHWIPPRPCGRWVWGSG